MQQDQASINFTAHNTGVKEILEASMPKLREMLQSQQLNLAEVNVSQQSFSGQGGQPQSPFFGQTGERQKQTNPEQEGEAEQSVPITDVANQIEQSRALVSNGLVSFYA
jgi:flagellar hook-length control protein FliK